VHAELALQNLAGTGKQVLDRKKSPAKWTSTRPRLPQKSLKMNLDGSVTVDLQAQEPGGAARGAFRRNERFRWRTDVTRPFRRRGSASMSNWTG